MPRKTSVLPRTGRDARLAARAGEFKGQTAGVAPGYVQGNLAILPASLAGDFLRFCQLNPKPCPLLAASAPGDHRLPTLADDLDMSAADRAAHLDRKLATSPGHEVNVGRRILAPIR